MSPGNAVAIHSGVAGFNPAPRPHSKPVWDMYETPKEEGTEAERCTLKRLMAAFGPAGPPKAWCKSNTICQAPPSHNMITYQRIKEESRDFGVMQRLQPRQSNNSITRWRTNPEVQAYFRDIVNGVNMSTRILTNGEAKVMNMYYPNQPWVIMDAPMMPSVHYPTRQGVNANATALNLIKMLRRAPLEIKELIFSRLDYISRDALSRTCVEACPIVSEYVTMWDLTTGQFYEAEYTEEEFEIVRNSGDFGETAAQRGTKYVMVSQSHMEWDNTQKIRPYPKYGVLAENFGRMLRAFDLQGNMIVTLTLCHIPFLDLKGVAVIVGLCPSLRRCEVLKCEMIRLHHLAPFLNQCVRKDKKHPLYDIAPLFEGGPRWSGSPDRKGTYGLTHSDSGTKLPVCFTKQCIYHLFPAIYAAGQQHMIWDLSSLWRRWAEALPLPADCVPLVISVYEAMLKVDAMKKAREERWATENFHPPQVLPRFDESQWPEDLANKVSLSVIEIHIMTCKAMFGDAMWAETWDRGTRSNNFQCRLDNYKLWTIAQRCTECEVRLPRIFFTASHICEDCRTQNHIDDETNHMKRDKIAATEKLGFGRLYDAVFKDLSQSNFPQPDAFQEVNEDGKIVPIIKRTYDFMDRVLDAPMSSFRPFIDAAVAMDQRERFRPLGHYTNAQANHRQSGNEDPYATVMEQLKMLCYRRAQTKEEFLLCGDAGFTPEQASQFLPW